MRKIIFISIWLLAYTASAQQPDVSVLKIKSPEIFRAVFKTTKGDFEIEANRKWSPLAVDRLYQLISSGFYNNALLFRVEPGFITQFGVAANEKLNRFWDPKKLPDEPRLQKNLRGTIAFARGRKPDRCTQIFINYTNNPVLDTLTRGNVKGYTPIAKIIRGMEIAAKFNAGYGSRPAAMQDSLYKYGNVYFEKRFPAMDRIISARIIK